MITRTRFRIDGVAERGAALVELAVVLPVLVVIMAGTTDFARVFYTSNVLNNAARAGAQYGAQTSATASDTSGMETIAQSVVTGNLSGTATISASRLCECADDGGTFFSTSPANSCTDACTGKHMVIRVTVSATKTFSTIAQLPGVPSTLTITRNATLRAR